MKHARDDYARIQDPDNKIPMDEPVFILRAQDKVAPATILFWTLEAYKAGASQNITSAALEQCRRMFAWQAEHGSKVPDMP